MPIAEARIATDRPRRYLVQFCRHAGAMGSSTGHRLRGHGGDAALGHVAVRAEWSDAEGTVTFDPWGQCRLTATESTLSLRVDAYNADALRRIEEIVANDIERFSRHQLAVAWRTIESKPIERQPE